MSPIPKAGVKTAHFLQSDFHSLGLMLSPVTAFLFFLSSHCSLEVPSIRTRPQVCLVDACVLATNPTKEHSHYNDS